MRLCEEEHEEVAYEKLMCPACEALEQLKDMTEERDELQKECDTRDTDASERDDKIAELEEKLGLDED